MKNSLEILYPSLPRRSSRRRTPPGSITVINGENLQSLITRLARLRRSLSMRTTPSSMAMPSTKSMVELGYDEIAVVVVGNRTEAEIRALRLAPQWYQPGYAVGRPKVKAEFEALIALSFDLELTGFDAVEIDMALSIDAPIGNTVEEVVAADVEPKAGPTVTQPGDVWHLGRHVVACGTPATMATFAALVGDARVAVCLHRSAV